jgi:hypothetical protein
VRRSAVLLLALVLAGCGANGRDHGTATLWVTRDRGAHVIFSGPVSAGSDGIRTVERKLKVTTRYGGRYLQSVNSLAGSLTQQRDWFFYVNGVEGGRSAAEVRIQPGDVLWWDFRSWNGASMHIPVVAGAYPHPFVDAPTSIVAKNRPLAGRIAQQVHGVVNAKRTMRNFIVIDGGRGKYVHIRPFRHGYYLELGIDAARRLAADRNYLRYRFAT